MVEEPAPQRGADLYVNRRYPVMVSRSRSAPPFSTGGFINSVNPSAKSGRLVESGSHLEPFAIIILYYIFVSKLLLK